MLKITDIQRLATECGIDAIGAARAEYLAEDDAFVRQWVAEGKHGSMSYLERNQDLRADPRLLVSGTKTVLVALQNYYTGQRQQTNAPFIAQSGLSIEDYHLVMKHSLRELGFGILELGIKGSELGVWNYELGEELSTLNSQLSTFCDSAPILERRWAVRAGLGWIGKNHQFIHIEMGSFVHIGILLLPFEIDGYGEEMPSRCGDCNLCVSACPTKALRVGQASRLPDFDSRRCLSYLTIERKEPLLPQFQGIASKHLYGCDCCQAACPYNQNLQPNTHEGLQANAHLLNITAEDWEHTSRRQRLKLLRRLAK